MKKKVIGYVAIMLMITVATLPALGSDTSTDPTTPKTNGYVNTLFYKFFERFPNAFPLLKYFFVINGFFDDVVQDGTGSLVVLLTDAPPELNITEALVTISEVTVHQAGTNDTNGSWITIVNESQTFDLIQLQNATDVLGGMTLTAGWYTQIRLYVENALVTIDGVQYDLKIPSKNIKLISPFLVQDNQTLTLTLDFDVQKSIHQAGNSDKYIMKPTIKVIQEGGPMEFEADAGGDYHAAVDEVIQFTGTAWGGVEPYTWAWDFGDGATATEQNPQHAYSAEGTYDITLTVTDANNQTATDDTEAEIEID